MHDLVLVRNAELACRNSWDQDLWQPRPAGAKAQRQPALSATEPQIPRIETQPATPAATFAGDNPTDRVTSIMVSRIGTPQETRTSPPAVAGGQSTRVEEHAQRETGRTAGDARSHPEGVSALEPGYNRALRSRSITGRKDTGATHAQQSDRPEDVERDCVLDPPQASQRPTFSDQTSPLPTDEVNRIFRARSSGAGQPPGVAQNAPTTGMGQSGMQAAQRAPTVHVDGVDLTDVTARRQFTARGEPAAAIGPSPIDERKWVAGIPRSCDTCRDFQRDSNGRSGYCGNAHAFGRRTMVECDQLACRSSVGVWWLPSDDLWLDRAEISHHTRPTPYLDAILSELRSASR